MRWDIPGYVPIEAPLPEDMQSIVAQLRAQRRTKLFPFHFGRSDKAMTFVELMEHPERALSTALKRSASQLNGWHPLPCVANASCKLSL